MRELEPRSRRNRDAKSCLACSPLLAFSVSQCHVVLGTALLQLLALGLLPLDRAAIFCSEQNRLPRAYTRPQGPCIVSCFARVVLRVPREHSVFSDGDGIWEQLPRHGRFEPCTLFTCLGMVSKFGMSCRMSKAIVVG